MFRLFWIIDDIEVSLEQFDCMGTAMNYADESTGINTFTLKWDGWGAKYLFGVRTETGKIDWRSTESLKQVKQEAI